MQKSRLLTWLSWMIVIYVLMDISFGRAGTLILLPPSSLFFLFSILFHFLFEIILFISAIIYLHKTMTISPFEILSDLILFFFLILPLFFIILFMTTNVCNGWNEGSMHGTCSIPFLSGIYDSLMNTLLILAFGGFVVYLPIIILALIISIFCKIKNKRFLYKRKK